MDLNNLEKKPVGSFLRKPELVETKKFKIVSLTERDSNFKEGKKELVIGLEDKNKDSFMLQISNTDFNELLDMYGPNFEDDWKGKLVKITAIDDGEKEVEGTKRQCYTLKFEKA